MALSLKALDGLIKLHKSNIDLYRVQLATFVQELIKLQNDLIKSDQTIKKEKEFFTSLDDITFASMAITLEQFLKRQLLKQQALIAQIMELHEKMTLLQENIVKENQTMKKYDIIKEKEIKRQLQAQQAKEQKALDEVILNQINKNLY